MKFKPNRLPMYQIGQKYYTRGANSKLCTVVDVHTTYNSSGEQVKLRYVSTHIFMGQLVTNSDVVETTIAMGKV